MKETVFPITEERMEFSTDGDCTIDSPWKKGWEEKCIPASDPTQKRLLS